MHLGEHLDLLVLLVQKILQLANFTLENSHTLLQGLGVAPRKGPPTELVRRLALKAHIRALRARWLGLG